LTAAAESHLPAQPARQHTISPIPVVNLELTLQVRNVNASLIRSIARCNTMLTGHKAVIGRAICLANNAAYSAHNSSTLWPLMDRAMC